MKIGTCSCCSLFKRGSLEMIGASTVFTCYECQNIAPCDRVKYGVSAIFKLGLDFHGVISKQPQFFSRLTKDLFISGWQIHILTGPVFENMEQKLKNAQITYTHFFSITQHHIDLGTEVTYDDKGDPWMEIDLWNIAKAEYCEKNRILLHLDDTKEYLDLFKTPAALYK